MSSPDLTLADVRRIVALMKAHELPAERIKSQTEADIANEQARALGLSYEWKVGDEYYVLAVPS